MDLRDRVRDTYKAVRANRVGGLTIKILIAVLGAAVVAVGALLIPLPGPGWLIVIAGLAIWAVEFAWARHLLTFTKDKLLAWTRWVRRQSWPIRLLIGAAGLVFVATVAVFTFKYSFGIDLFAEGWKYVTTH